MAPTTTRAGVAFLDADVSTANDLAVREVVVGATRLEAAVVLPVVVAALRSPTREEAAESTRCRFDHSCFAEACS